MGKKIVGKQIQEAARDAWLCSEAVDWKSAERAAAVMVRSQQDSSLGASRASGWFSAACGVAVLAAGGGFLPFAATLLGAAAVGKVGWGVLVAGAAKRQAIAVLSSEGTKWWLALEAKGAEATTMWEHLSTFMYSGSPTGKNTMGWALDGRGSMGGRSLQIEAGLKNVSLGAIGALCLRLVAAWGPPEGLERRALAKLREDDRNARMNGAKMGAALIPAACARLEALDIAEGLPEEPAPAPKAKRL
jgi:hypothetical protein